MKVSSINYKNIMLLGITFKNIMLPGREENKNEELDKIIDSA